MPLPWKKARISRISRLMADLHPNKPCNSMLVQTGFPTSLVDLLVKNCDSLKRPRKKKNHKPHRRQVVEVSAASDPPAGESPPVNLSNDEFNCEDNDRSVDRRFEMNHETNEVFNGLNSACCSRDRRGVVYGVFVVFVAVILALMSFRIVTLGITMAACVLIFIEYVSLAPFRVIFVRFKAAGVLEAEIIGGEDVIELDSPAEEIQEAESEKAGFDLRLGYSEEEEEGQCDGVTLEKVQKRRRRSSGEFIKKLVPKKWRQARKVKGTKEFTGDNEQIQQLFDLGIKERSIESDSQSNSSSKSKELQLKEEGDGFSDELPTELATDLTENQDKEAAVAKKDKKGSSFLLLVALAGLVGGRILALGLTVVSCFVVQLVVMRARNQSVKLKNNSKNKSLSSN